MSPIQSIRTSAPLFAIFGRFFFLKLLGDTIVDACYRFLAQGNVPLAVSTSVFYAGISFLLVRQIAADEAKGGAAIAGYIVGGGAGTWLGIVLSKAVTGI